MDVILHSSTTIVHSSTSDNIEMTIELIHPVAMEQGLTFAIREGGRTVGSGRVATIIE